MLEKELQQAGVINVKEVLSTRKDVSMVLAVGADPAGRQKGDPIDVEVTLPAGSKTTSLEGGYLEHANLRDYAQLSAIAPTVSHGSNSYAPGHILAVAEGQAGGRHGRRRRVGPRQAGAASGAAPSARCRGRSTCS